MAFISNLVSGLFNSMMYIVRRMISIVVPSFGRVTHVDWADTTMEKRYMIVGLGNSDRPGTRHSVGHEVVDRLAEKLGLHWKVTKDCGGRVASVVVDKQLLLVLLKPIPPMNLNGTSVQKTAKKCSIPAENIYLCHDELDKPLGKLQLKAGGSARGHRGVRSCQDCLRTDVMPRLLIGIGRPASQSQVSSYVLSPFTQAERAQIPEVLDKAITLLHEHVQQSAKMMLNFPRLNG